MGSGRLTVSVCIPTIPGREAMLRRALASVHDQRRQPDALLIERDADRRGAAWARNRLLQRAETDVLAWLDDDDRLAENHLIACMRVLENDRSADLVYPRPRMVGGPDPTAVTHQGVFPVSPWGLRWCGESAFHLRTYGSFIPMTHLVRTGKAREAGGFPEGRWIESPVRRPDGSQVLAPRYQGEDERYLIALLDAGATFEHLDAPTWYWTVNPASTAGRGTATTEERP
jgi:glycosyltransferase involved in cell wall biosynthesis